MCPIFARHMQKSVTKLLPPLFHQIALFQRPFQGKARDCRALAKLNELLDFLSCSLHHSSAEGPEPASD